jgi:hypothetical protein
LPFIAAWGRYINHNKRYLWHVANNCQYPDNKYDYDEKIFLNENDTIVYISQYQVEEIHNQYDDVRCKEVDFKLFINKL